MTLTEQLDAIGPTDTKLYRQVSGLLIDLVTTGRMSMS